MLLLFSLRAVHLLVMASRPQPVQSILETSPQLCALVQRAHHQLGRTEEIRKLLPPDLAAHLLAAIGEGELLVLLTDSSVWASRLRFSTAALRRRLPAMRNVRVRVVPPGAPVGKAKTKPPAPVRLSPSSAQQMRAVAASIADPTLRAALERLASRAARVSEY
jgi:hypothetical protein